MFHLAEILHIELNSHYFTEPLLKVSENIIMASQTTIEIKEVVKQYQNSALILQKYLCM